MFDNGFSIEYWQIWGLNLQSPHGAKNLQTFFITKCKQKVYTCVNHLLQRGFLQLSPLSLTRHDFPVFLIKRVRIKFASQIKWKK